MNKTLIDEDLAARKAPLNMDPEVLEYCHQLIDDIAKFLSSIRNHPLLLRRCHISCVINYLRSQGRWCICVIRKPGPAFGEQFIRASKFWGYITSSPAQLACLRPDCCRNQQQLWCICAFTHGYRDWKANYSMAVKTDRLSGRGRNHGKWR